MVYAYIHNPILSLTRGIGLIKLLYPIAIISFIANTKSCTRLFSFYQKEMLLFSFLFIYALFRGALGGETTISYAHFILLIECFFLSGIFTAYWYKTGRTEQDYIRLILIVSAVASAISTLCVAIPSFGTYVRFQLQITPEDSVLADALFRGFGISEELTSGYGYVQSICFVVGLRYIKDNKWFIVFMPMVILSVVLSARTGIIIMAIGVVLHLLTLQKAKYAFATVGVFAILITFAFLFFKSLDLSEESIDFVQGFFDEASEMRESNDFAGSTTTSALFNDMIIWPRDIGEWIIGRGYSLFLAKTGNSDIGYIIQLNYGGLAYMFIWVMILFRLFTRMRKKCFDKFIPLFLIVSILILNVKGNTLSNGSIMRFTMLIYFVLSYNISKATSRVSSVFNSKNTGQLPVSSTNVEL